MKKILRLILAFQIVWCFPLISNAYSETVVLNKKFLSYSQDLDIREGDFIFQHLPGRLTRVIADITNSPYSHCGIIVKKQSNFYVLEAIGPVIETPLNTWINRGIGHRITIVRLKEKYQRDIPKIIKAANKFKGLPYDVQYDWDNEKIYCSELIYKAVDAAIGLQLTNFVNLGDLSWQPHEAFIRYITGGELPLDRKMITPADIVVSDKVDIVYSSFPPKPQEGIVFETADLAGVWSGDYTFPGNQLIQVNLNVDDQGKIQEGQLAPNIYIYPSNIKKFNSRTGEFNYVFYDNNQVKTVIDGKIDPTKDALFGQWNDSRGFRGVFSLAKLEKTEEIKPEESRLLRQFNSSRTVLNNLPPQINVPYVQNVENQPEVLNEANYIWVANDAAPAAGQITQQPKKRKGGFSSMSTAR